MFTSDRPYIFHIELTDKCNAGCPMCPRTDQMNFCKADRSKVWELKDELERQGLFKAYEDRFLDLF